MADLLPTITSILVGAGGLAGTGALYKAFTERKKVPVDINVAMIGGAERSLIVMKGLVDDAEERIKTLKQELAECKAEHREEMTLKNRELAEARDELRRLRLALREQEDRILRLEREVAEALDDNRK